MPNPVVRSTAVELELEADRGGRPILRDLRGRKTWRGPGPALVLEVFNIPETRVNTASSDDAELKINSTSRKLSATYTWPRWGISLTVEYRPEDDHVEIRIPLSRIREQLDMQYRVKSVELWPWVAAAKRNTPGYMLLPNFCGAACSFDKTETLTHRSFIYMHQSQWEQWCSFPVFASVQRRHALMGLITGGEFDAEVVYHLNRDGAPLHTTGPCLHLRDNKTDAIDPVDRAVRYYPLSGKEAGYLGMAKLYRRHLVNDLNVPTLAQRAADNPNLAWELSAYSSKIFMAMKSRKPDGRGRFAVFTTFDQARRIVKQLKRAGIERASYQLTGWSPDGHDGLYPTRLPVDDRLGGLEGMRRLIDEAAALDHRIGVHDNYVDQYRLSPDFDPDCLMPDRDGEPSRGGIWGGGLCWQVCSHQTLKLARADMHRVRDLGINGIYYLDAMPRTLRTCFAPDHDHAPTRRAEARGIVELFRYAQKTMHPLPVGGENVLPYTLGVQDYGAHVVSAVPDRKSTLLCHFVDRLVPFFHIAIHGLIKYHLNDLKHHEQFFGSPRAGLLKELEYGATPRLEWVHKDKYLNDPGYLHMGEFRHLVDVASEQYRVLCDRLGPCQQAFIEEHDHPKPHLSRTAYSNGVVVTVDHERAEYKIDGA